MVAEIGSEPSASRKENIMFAFIETVGIGLGVFFACSVFALLFSSTSIQPPAREASAEPLSDEHAPFGWKWDSKIRSWARCGPDGEIDEL